MYTQQTLDYTKTVSPPHLEIVFLDSDDNTSHTLTSKITQLFTPPFNEDDTSSVYLLQFTNSDLKLKTPNGCSSRKTGGTPPSNQRLRRHYSL